MTPNYVHCAGTMYAHCLRLKLKEKNVDCDQAHDQLFWRAASQVNTYMRMVNSRVGIGEDSDVGRFRFLDLVSTIQQVKTLEQAETLANYMGLYTDT